MYSPTPSESVKPLIIIVDDDTSLLKLLRSVLRRDGFRVLTAGSGDDALRICTRFRRRIDAMITDIEMPGISGFRLAEQVAVKRPGMPVLFMSGSFTGAHCLTVEGAPKRWEFLQKPFSGAGLTSKLEALIPNAGNARRWLDLTDK